MCLDAVHRVLQHSMHLLTTPSARPLSSRGDALNITHVKELGGLHSSTSADNVHVHIECRYCQHSKPTADTDGLGRSPYRVAEFMGKFLKLFNRLILVLGADLVN